MLRCVTLLEPSRRVISWPHLLRLILNIVERRVAHPDFNNSEEKLVVGDNMRPLKGPNQCVLKGHDCWVWNQLPHYFLLAIIRFAAREKCCPMDAYLPERGSKKKGWHPFLWLLGTCREKQQIMLLYALCCVILYYIMLCFALCHTLFIHLY